MEFTSNGCEACKIMEPVINEIEDSYSNKIKVKKVNVYSDVTLTRKYSIRVVPTILLLDSEGKLLYRYEGITEREIIVEKLKEMGVN
ncbi:Thioredoxin-1 [compost metagenome]